MRIKWRTDPFEPYFWISEKDSDYLEEYKVRFGDEFNIKILEQGFCIGSDYSRGKWLTCVANQKRLARRNHKRENYSTNKIASKYMQCSKCKASEYFTCRMLCRGDVCTPTTQKAKKLCDPPNTSVYLTYVGGSFKVGVSLGVRRRWVEQASDVATVVAKAPGLEARRIEHTAAEMLELNLQVRNSTKMKYLNNIDYDSVKEQLYDIISDMDPIIDGVIKDIPGEKIDNPDIMIFNDVYGDLTFSKKVKKITPKPGQEFGGEIVALKGSILVVKQNKNYYCMDMKKLRGMRFEFINHPARVAEHDPLDNWF